MKLVYEELLKSRRSVFACMWSYHKLNAWHPSLRVPLTAPEVFINTTLPNNLRHYLRGARF